MSEPKVLDQQVDAGLKAWMARVAILEQLECDKESLAEENGANSVFQSSKGRGRVRRSYTLPFTKSALVDTTNLMPLTFKTTTPDFTVAVSRSSSQSGEASVPSTASKKRTHNSTMNSPNLSAQAKTILRFAKPSVQSTAVLSHVGGSSNIISQPSGCRSEDCARTRSQYSRATASQHDKILEAKVEAQIRAEIESRFKLEVQAASTLSTNSRKQKHETRALASDEVRGYNFRPRLSEYFPTFANLFFLVWELRVLIFMFMVLSLIIYLVMSLSEYFIWLAPVFKFLHNLWEFSETSFNFVRSTASWVAEFLGSSTIKLTSMTSVAASNTGTLLSSAGRLCGGLTLPWLTFAKSTARTTTNGIPPKPTVRISYFDTYRRVIGDISAPIANYEDLFQLSNEAYIASQWLRSASFEASQASSATYAQTDQNSRENLEDLAIKHLEASETFLEVRKALGNFTYNRRRLLSRTVSNSNDALVSLRRHLEWELEPGPTWFFPWTKPLDRRDRIRKLHSIYMYTIRDFITHTKELLDQADVANQRLSHLDGLIQDIEKLLEKNRKLINDEKLALDSSTTGFDAYKFWLSSHLELRKKNILLREQHFGAMRKRSKTAQACFQHVRDQLGAMVTRMEGEKKALFEMKENPFRHSPLGPQYYFNLDFIEIPEPPTPPHITSWFDTLLGHPPLNVILWFLPGVAPVDLSLEERQLQYLLKPSNYGPAEIQKQLNAVETIAQNAELELAFVDRTGAEAAKKLREMNELRFDEDYASVGEK